MRDLSICPPDLPGLLNLCVLNKIHTRINLVTYRMHNDTYICIQVSCCVETLLGGAGSSGFLPENCEIEACPTRFDPPTSTPGSTNPMPGSTNPMPGNSALKFIAMPLAILTAFLVAIVTHVHL